MKRVLLLAVSITMMVSSAMSQSFGVQNYIDVRGNSEIRVEPNEFYLSIVIDEAALRGKVSLDDAHRQMVAALKGCGVDTNEKLKLSDLSSAAKRRNEAQTTVTYGLLLNSAETLVNSLEALDKVGISRVSVVKTAHTDIERYRDEARVAAVASARKRADALGKALGQGVGDCFQIVDKSYYNDGVMMSSAMFRNDDSADMGSLKYSDIVVKYSVDARFVLKIDKSSEGSIIK